LTTFGGHLGGHLGGHAPERVQRFFVDERRTKARAWVWGQLSDFAVGVEPPAAFLDLVAK